MLVLLIRMCRLCRLMMMKKYDCYRFWCQLFLVLNSENLYIWKIMKIVFSSSVMNRFRWFQLVWLWCRFCLVLWIIFELVIRIKVLSVVSQMFGCSVGGLVVLIMCRYMQLVIRMVNSVIFEMMNQVMFMKLLLYLVRWWCVIGMVYLWVFVYLNSEQKNIGRLRYSIVVVILKFRLVLVKGLRFIVGLQLVNQLKERLQFISSSEKVVMNGQMLFCGR